MPKSNPWCHEHIIHKHGGTKIKYPTKRGKARWTKDGKVNQPTEQPINPITGLPDIQHTCELCGEPLEWSNIWTTGTNTLCHGCWFKQPKGQV